MAKCLIIGAGLSGLSAAVYLSDAGHDVTIIERSPKAGGRAYSFRNKNGYIVDNGQHVLTGSCYNTLEYLEKIKTRKLIIENDRLEINIRGKGGKAYRLKAFGKLYPLNLILGILAYKPLTYINRIKLLLFLSKLKITNTTNLELKTVKKWLDKSGATSEMFGSFWDLIVNATMNTTAESASAETFARLLKELFFKGNYAASILIPGSDLSGLFVENAIKFIKNNGGRIIYSEKLIAFYSKNDIISRVETTSCIHDDFDFVISSIPKVDYDKIGFKLPEALNNLTLKSSSIVTLHIWLQSNPFREKYYGLINSKIHWLFNHSDYITTVTSCADGMVGISNNEIEQIALKEIVNYFPEFNLDIVTEVRVIKEKRATFIPDVETEKKRKGLPFKAGNLYFAGDWTNTGYPGTIEGAIKSGKLAAESICYATASHFN
ncbi:MAG: hydroxysqualene dehydroxylase HpnE [Bacteroidetes bacterium]|nr:hydroxysqualene dehydroxylase HpnE [Bacteroidota bacterium]